MDDLDRLQQRLGVRFRNPQLLDTALNHRSYLNEAPADVESNERLEFLGDAVLGLVVTRWLFDEYPALAEGRLTHMRSEVVRWESLARVAEPLDLGAALHLSRGEAASGGRTKPLNLARALEAVIGALSIDSGYAVTRTWLLKLLRPRLREITADLEEDAKSRLQHLAQKQFGAPPRYRILAMHGPDHGPTFLVEVTIKDRPYGQGEGRTKQAAQQAAARATLAAIAAAPDRAPGTVRVPQRSDANPLIDPSPERVQRRTPQATLALQQAVQPHETSPAKQRRGSSPRSGPRPALTAASTRATEPRTVRDTTVANVAAPKRARTVVLDQRQTAANNPRASARDEDRASRRSPVPSASRAMRPRPLPLTSRANAPGPRQLPTRSLPTSDAHLEPPCT